MTRLKKLRALADGTIYRLLKWRGMNQAELDAEIEEHYVEAIISLDFSAVTRAMTVIKEGFERVAIAIGQAAFAIGILALAFDEIEREETRGRVLGWEGIWLWK